MTALPRLTLILGGARSGKSRHAEGLVESQAPPWTYIATAEPVDHEMRARIAAHRERRADSWITQETPLNITAAIRAAPPATPVLIDCLTLWLSNILLADRETDGAIEDLVQACRRAKGPLVLV